MPVIEEPVTISIKKIVLATDFSKVSEKAVAYATGMALRFGSSVEVTHVFDPSAVGTYEEAIIGLPVSEREEMYAARLLGVCEFLAEQGIEARGHLPIGHDISRTLIEAAGECEAELIVTGTQSKQGIARFLLGSTAEALIRNASCPVLTVGPYARWPIRGPLVFRNIVFATDLSATAAKALPYALSFAEDSGAHLHLCMVMEDKLMPEQVEPLKAGFREEMKALIPERAYDWCTPECLVERGEAADAILRVAEQVDADLIVLGPRQSSFWLSFVEHGVTPEVIAGSLCPVLTVS